MLELFQFFVRSESNKPLLTLIDVSNLVKYEFAYLKESLLKSDFQFAFNRPSLADIFAICEQKERDWVGAEFRMVASCEERLLDSLRLGEGAVTEEILQTFDTQNPLEEKARLTFISGQ